jgi:hypothetical protein
MAHEITAAFAAAGLPLCRSLAEMLDEHFSHRTERRGCGFVQATRFLSTYVNLPRDPADSRDLRVFAGAPLTLVDELGQRLVEGGEPRGWRALVDTPLPDTADEAGAWLARLRSALVQIGAGLQFEESRLFFGLLHDLLAGSGAAAAQVPGMPEKPKIGSCSQAEEYFLEIAHGRVRRGGQVNAWVDAQGQGILLEKVGLGESHSAIVVAPLCIEGVMIPPGSLCALRYDDSALGTRRSAKGCIAPLEALQQVRFLRLTTLSVAPDIRRRAFSHQLDAQLRANLFSPTTTTLDHLRGFARTLTGEQA